MDVFKSKNCLEKAIFQEERIAEFPLHVSLLHLAMQ
jgi:hypothetical protein